MSGLNGPFISRALLPLPVPWLSAGDFSDFDPECFLILFSTFVGPYTRDFDFTATGIARLDFFFCSMAFSRKQYLKKTKVVILNPVSDNRRKTI